MWAPRTRTRKGAESWGREPGEGRAPRSLRDGAGLRREALAILGDLAALWTSLDDNGKQAWGQVLFEKLVINDRGKVVDRVLNHPFDEILEFKEGRSNSVRLSSP
jgi:hypothetical protein